MLAATWRARRRAVAARDRGHRRADAQHEGGGERRGVERQAPRADERERGAGHHRHRHRRLDAGAREQRPHARGLAREGHPDEDAERGERDRHQHVQVGEDVHRQPAEQLRPEQRAEGDEEGERRRGRVQAERRARAEPREGTAERAAGRGRRRSRPAQREDQVPAAAGHPGEQPGAPRRPRVDPADLGGRRPRLVAEPRDDVPGREAGARGGRARRDLHDLGALAGPGPQHQPELAGVVLAPAGRRPPPSRRRRRTRRRAPCGA